MAPTPGKTGKGTGISHPGKGGKVVPGRWGAISKSTVIAKFVDEIPPDDKSVHLLPFQPQEGFQEGLELAMANPGRAMLLVTYDVDSPSKCRGQAKLRARGLVEKGYSEVNGWTVRAVEDSVYVMFDPRGL